MEEYQSSATALTYALSPPRTDTRNARPPRIANLSVDTILRCGATETSTAKCATQSLSLLNYRRSTLHQGLWPQNFAGIAGNALLFCVWQRTSFFFSANFGAGKKQKVVEPKSTNRAPKQLSHDNRQSALQQEVPPRTTGRLLPRPSWWRASRGPRRSSRSSARPARKTRSCWRNCKIQLAKLCQLQRGHENL